MMQLLCLRVHFIVMLRFYKYHFGNAPDIILPVIANSLATSIRINSLSVIEADMSGINPNLLSIRDILQSGVAKRKSAPNAICIPGLIYKGGGTYKSELSYLRQSTCLLIRISIALRKFT